MKYGQPKIGEIYKTVRSCLKCKRRFTTEAHDIILPMIGRVRNIDGNIVCNRCSKKATSPEVA